MYKTASKIKLRVQTSKGLLSVEDLWDLNLKELNDIAKALNKELKSLDEEDFLDDKPSEDPKKRLIFDIIVDIIKTRKEEISQNREARAKSSLRQKYLDALEKKEDEDLEKLSKEEILEKLNSL